MNHVNWLKLGFIPSIYDLNSPIWWPQKTMFQSSPPA